MVKLSDTLIKINKNQGVSTDNMSTPQSPELIPPLTLILPWCFGALVLSDDYEAGKLSALRLLCTVTLHCDNKTKNYLPQFFRFLHSGKHTFIIRKHVFIYFFSALNSSSKSVLNTCLKYLGPRFLSLQLPGSSLLILDLIHACNTVLNNTDNLESSPRTEAVSILANLLSQPENLSNISVLQPDKDIQVITCPDIKVIIVKLIDE